MDRSSNLLDVSLGLDQKMEPWPLRKQVVLIEDCVETSGSFVLHQLIKRILSPNSSTSLVLLAFSHTFSHYDRILRKLGCNLGTHRDNHRFFFFDMLMLHCPDGDKPCEGGLVALYKKIHKTISSLPDMKNKSVTIMVDDMSLMEVSANGSSDHVLDFLHYCHTLTSEFHCSLVMLNHGDIYSSIERPVFKLRMEYLADVVVKAEPLATGLANDVHGQLTVLNKGTCQPQVSSRKTLHNFHFKVKENSIEYFYPGCQA